MIMNSCAWKLKSEGNSNKKKWCVLLKREETKRKSEPTYMSKKI